MKANNHKTRKPVIFVFVALFAVIGTYLLINSSAVTATCDLYAAPTSASPAGSDTAGNGTITAPFATITKLDSALSPGQTGCMRAGVYGNKTTAFFALNKSGTPTGQITIRSYPGEVAEINGFIEMGSTNNGGQYKTLSYLKINGTNTQYPGGSAVTTYPECAPSSQGLQINGTGDIFEHNEYFQEAPYRGNGLGVGFQVNSGWTAPNNAIIRFNKLHSVGSCADEDHLIYLSHGDNVEIHDNWMWDDPAGWGVQLYPGPKNAKIYNNVIDSAGTGFVIGDAGSDVTSGNQIYHNIVLNSTGISNKYIGWAGFPGAMLSCSSNNSASINNTVSNNVSFNNPSGINYDCPTAHVTLSGNVTADPQFADASYKTSHDYRLKATSPSAGWGMWDGDLGTPKKPGDTNADNVVDIIDLSTLLSKWNTNYTNADFNNDQTINIFDLSILLTNFGSTSSPPSTTYMFQDEFNAASGTPADITKWILHTEKCDAPADYACPKNANIFHDGSGNLVLRTKRETANWLTGGPYSGAWLSTFNYGSGWPATPIKASLTVPYKIEMRAIMPNTPGAWPSIWTINVDRPTTQNIYELDVAEERMTTPTSAGCHQHTWLGGADKSAWDGSVTVSNMGLNWHTYSANVYTDRVEYKVDGLACGTAYGVSGQHGVILNNLIAMPGSWGSGGGQPASSDPGPWDFKIDYIRATGL